MLLPSESEAGVDSARRTLPFLDLPKKVRTAIYYLCLVRSCPIDLLGRRDPEDDYRRYTYQPECWYQKKQRGMESQLLVGERLCNCPRLPLELTLVCRQVRDESLDVLLGANLFLLKPQSDDKQALWPLLTMPERHLSRMRRLAIRLNCWPCPEGHESIRSAMGPDGSCFLCNTSFDTAPAPNLNVLSEWKSLCRRLGRTTPGIAELTVIYDAKDEARAHDIVDPLIEFLPTLRACTLRLGPNPAEGQAGVAQRTALALTGAQLEPQTDKPFPFKKLPWELKLRILEHTHLGIPQLGGYDPNLTRVNVVNGRLLKGRVFAKGAFRVTCCQKCSDTLADWQVHSFPWVLQN